MSNSNTNDTPLSSSPFSNEVPELLQKHLEHTSKPLHVPEVVASVYEWALITPEIQRELIDRYFLELKSKKKGNGQT